MTINSGQIGFFTASLMHWNRHVNNRQMPWKGEKVPYKIWLSEIILQQTRVEQGLEYYIRFISKYPTISSLANAVDNDVFKLWEGLGYYSRCRNLLAAARQIKDTHNGIFPDKYDEILQLKGVGPYTAAAIASFAFKLPYAVLDGNVIRVLSRYFGIDTPFDTTIGKKYFAEFAQQLIEGQPADVYNQAIMDFGATVCKPLLPLCNQCELQSHCTAFQTQRVTLLPVKSKKIKKTQRWFTYCIIKHKNQILIRERNTKDIWRHLHEFYLIEDLNKFESNITDISNKLASELGGKVQFITTYEPYTQQLTHQTIFARFLKFETEIVTITPESYRWVKENELKNFPLPKIINTFLSTNLIW